MPRKRSGSTESDTATAGTKQHSGGSRRGAQEARSKRASSEKRNPRANERKRRPTTRRTRKAASHESHPGLLAYYLDKLSGMLFGELLDWTVFPLIEAGLNLVGIPTFPGTFKTARKGAELIFSYVVHQSGISQKIVNATCRATRAAVTKLNQLLLPIKRAIKRVMGVSNGAFKWTMSKGALVLTWAAKKATKATRWTAKKVAEICQWAAKVAKLAWRKLIEWIFGK